MMNMGKNGSKDLYEEMCDITPGGVSSPVRAFKPYPIFAGSGSGSTIIDVDGNEYTDYCMAYGPLILGHSHQNVTTAVRKQLRNGTVYGMPSEPEYGLIKRICDCVPCADEARLTSTGTEATMHAVRLARGYTGRNKIIKIDGGFHGANDHLMFNGVGPDLEPKAFSAGVPECMSNNIRIARYNDLESFGNIMEKDEDIAAVIIEPYMGNAGIIPPKKGFLEGLRRITSEHGVLLIFDEVITGFRVAKGGVQELSGVKPDMCTLGKIIGGGFPAGAVAGRRDIMEHMAPFGDVYAAGTFSGNPVTAAAGCATIDLLSPAQYGKLERYTDSIVKGMTDHIYDSGIKACVNSALSMFQVFFGCNSVSDNDESKKASRDRYMMLFRHMLSNGIYMPPSGGEVNFLSTAHDRHTTDRFIEAFGDFVRRGNE